MTEEIPTEEKPQKKARSAKRRRHNRGEGSFRIAGVEVLRGQRQWVELHLTRLYTSSDVVIPVHVVHGRQPGPRLFVSAAIHGDEINGTETIRQLLKLKALDDLRGTLLAIPVVNVHGFLAKTRYTPDRRDLNRSFPGLSKGSLAARVAKSFMDEVVTHCTHGIDLHTGSNHRSNLPHVRANLDDEETRELAEAFRVPVLINAKLRDGSLRQSAAEYGAKTLLFEGGEALRFQPTVTKAALRGILGVMQRLGMTRKKHKRKKILRAPFYAASTKWIRAPESGLLISNLQVGAAVEAGQVVGVISDPFGQSEAPVLAPHTGIVIGRLELPLVNEGDALFHVAQGTDVLETESAIQEYTDNLDGLLDPLELGGQEVPD